MPTWRSALPPYRVRRHGRAGFPAGREGWGGVKREVYYDADLEVGAPAPWGAPKLLVVLHVFAGEVFFNVFVFADEVFDFIGEVV